MDWKFSTRLILAASLVLTSGPAPVYAGPGVRPSPALELAGPEPDFLSFKVGPVPPEKCETNVVSEKFEPLEGALNRARQAVVSTVTQGQVALESGLGTQGAKHLHEAVIEVQKRIGDLESLSDDRETLREIGNLTWKDQLAKTLLGGERAEIYAHHFAAAETLMLRRLVGGLAEVAEASTKALELNEEVADITKSAPRASSVGKVERLQTELKELQNRRGDFLSASRKASELELEFVGALERLQSAVNAGNQFMSGLSTEQLASPSVRVLTRTLNNLSQLENGALLFKQTVQAFDTNIIEARNSFDHNVNLADLALQARASQLKLKAQTPAPAKQNQPSAEVSTQDKPKTALIAGGAALVIVVGVLLGMVFSSSGNSSRQLPYAPAEKSYTTPSSPSNSDGVYERPSRRYGCFLAGTKILTPAGSKNIETIKRGDTVMSFNHNTGAVEPARVVHIMKFEKRIVGAAHFSDGQEIVVTGKHEFYSLDRKAYVPVSELSTGESVRLINGKSVQLKSYVPRVEQQDVYNFEVEGNHNYFIGEGILVHNKMAIL